MDLYFKNIGIDRYQGKSEFIMNNLDGAWTYLLKLKLVKTEWYDSYMNAAHIEFIKSKRTGF